MCFLPLKQDFYTKTPHASLQNSSQIYAYEIKNKKINRSIMCIYSANHLQVIKQYLHKLQANMVQI